jgi:hypothetical protein
MAEILAVYTDNALRKGGMKALAEVNKEEEHLRMLVQLFTHLVDKDLFIEVYRSYLGKRLLNEKSQSIDQERVMISLIKMSCGPAFTKKLEGMLNDLALAHEEAKNYEKHRSTPTSSQEESKTHVLSSVDFQVTILTTSYWPTYKTFQDM